VRPTRLRALLNRLFQVLALYAPGAESVRPFLHRLRGVKLGREVFIGTDVIIETEYPRLVSIGDRVGLGIRSVIIAHQRGMVGSRRVREGEPSVRIDDDVFIGPGVLILPNLTIGHGAVVAAGSVVTRSVPPLTMVQGNPAVPVARCGIPLVRRDPQVFYRALTPINETGSDSGA
jgi:acetyltransferase-like isoleucine patch superfamily enzyme